MKKIQGGGKMERDNNGKGNLYFDLVTARITYVERAKRPSEKDWPGSDVIRIQAYKNPSKSKALFPGAEIPINEDAILEMIQHLCELVRTIRTIRSCFIT